MGAVDVGFEKRRISLMALARQHITVLSAPSTATGTTHLVWKRAK